MIKLDSGAILELLRGKGLSKEELARWLGVAPTLVNRWLRQGRISPTYGRRMADLLGVAIEQITLY